MNKVIPFLWLEGQAQEAAEFYVSVFENASIISSSQQSATVEVEGQRLILFNGGPHFKLDEAFSLMVDCPTQEEIDTKWEALTADGGEDSRCGWVKDKFGVSWQLIPPILPELLGHSDPAKAKSVMDAMLSMNKLDIAALKAAAE